MLSHTEVKAASRKGHGKGWSFLFALLFLEMGKLLAHSGKLKAV